MANKMNMRGPYKIYIRSLLVCCLKQYKGEERWGGGAAQEGNGNTKNDSIT